jgi:hypothetical protein
LNRRPLGYEGNPECDTCQAGPASLISGAEFPGDRLARFGAGRQAFTDRTRTIDAPSPRLTGNRAPERTDARHSQVVSYGRPAADPQRARARGQPPRRRPRCPRLSPRPLGRPGATRRRPTRARRDRVARPRGSCRGLPGPTHPRSATSFGAAPRRPRLHLPPDPDRARGRRTRAGPARGPRSGSRGGRASRGLAARTRRLSGRSVNGTRLRARRRGMTWSSSMGRSSRGTPGEEEAGLADVEREPARRPDPVVEPLGRGG